MANIDFALQDEGDIFILYPLTPEGEYWINTHVQITDETQFWMDGIVISHQYLRHTVTGIVADGLIVVEGRRNAPGMTPTPALLPKPDSSGELEKALERLSHVLKKDSPSPASIRQARKELLLGLLEALTKAVQENSHVIDAIKSSRTN